MAASASNKHSYLNSMTLCLSGQDATWLKEFLMLNQDHFGYSTIAVSSIGSNEGYIVSMEFADRPLRWGWFMPEFAWNCLQANRRAPQYEVLEWDRFEVTGPDLGDVADNTTLI